MIGPTPLPMECEGAVLEQLRNFADRVRQFSSNPAGGQPEDQLKRPIADLLEEAGGDLGLAVEVRTEVRAVHGRPDLGAIGGQPALRSS